MDLIKYGLCGEKLSHSYSEIIHKMLGNDEYRLLCMTKDEFYSFFRDRNFSAVNVTIPYKTDAYALCDAVSEEAEMIGSVNTVVNKNGRLFGYNTDILGFIYMLEKAGIEVCGKKVLILGTGGTSLTANAACKKLSAGQIVTVSRKGGVNYENVYTDHADAQIIINTTPVGMYPSNGVSPIDISRFSNLSGVADVIYNPGKTRLLLDASKRGIPTAGGLSMLVAQAVEADRIFFDKMGVDVKETSKKVLEKLEAGVRNIILVGMPGCGKTTVGKLLSEKLSRDFIDADDHLTEKEGRSPEEIIKNDGEDIFRALETKTLEEITKLSGKVISCGGGAVLRSGNRELIVQNSICVYIKRPAERLATSGRPLSSGGIGRLLELFEKRDPLYKECADFCVDLDEDSEKCAEKIIERFGFEK